MSGSMSAADEFINKVVVQDYDGVRQMLAAGHDVNAMKSGGVPGVGWNHAAEFAIPAADPVMLRILWEAGAKAANNPFLEQLFADFASGGDGSSILRPKVKPVGRFILHRFCGDEEFSVVRATIEAVKEGKNYQLCFKVHTDSVCVKSLPDTQELKARPNAEVTVKGNGLSPRSLVGKTLYVPHGYDDEEEDHLAVIYYKLAKCRAAMQEPYREGYCESNAAYNSSVVSRQRPVHSLRFEVNHAHPDYFDSPRLSGPAR